MIRGKKILLGITGSIAAYKAAILVRMLVKEGAEVKVIMTKSATGFINPLTLSTLSRNKVLIELSDEDNWVNHVLLARWADILIVAPASCNTIAKMSAGLCDNLLLAVYLSAVCPVFIAPSMDTDMWLHRATKENIDNLQRYGNKILPVNDGELASGLSGEGRMAEPEEILKYISSCLSDQGILKGARALVTAGPTYEALDPVRFIGNHSTGKMGVAIAEELAGRNAEVHLVLGPSAMKVDERITVQRVTSADEMYEACMTNFAGYDIIVMAAAVADYKPATQSAEKIKKTESAFTLNLVKTKDILSRAGELKSPEQTLVGFALETENETENALKKLSLKKADLLVLNSLKDAGAGFGYETNKITIFDKNGKEHAFRAKSKNEVATDIVNTIIKYRNE